MYSSEQVRFHPKNAIVTLSFTAKIRDQLDQFRKKIWSLKTDVLISVPCHSLPVLNSLTRQKNTKIVAGNKNCLS